MAMGILDIKSEIEHYESVVDLIKDDFISLVGETGMVDLSEYEFPIIIKDESPEYIVPSKIYPIEDNGEACGVSIIDVNGIEYNGNEVVFEDLVSLARYIVKKCEKRQDYLHFNIF